MYPQASSGKTCPEKHTSADHRRFHESPVLAPEALPPLLLFSLSTAATLSLVQIMSLCRHARLQ